MVKILKQKIRIRRHKRVRAKISGTETRPRLCVFRSNKHIYANLINDEKNCIILTASDKDTKKARSKKMKTELPEKSPRLTRLGN